MAIYKGWWERNEKTESGDKILNAEAMNLMEVHPLPLKAFLHPEMENVSVYFIELTVEKKASGKRVSKMYCEVYYGDVCLARIHANGLPDMEGPIWDEYGKFVLNVALQLGRFVQIGNFSGREYDIYKDSLGRTILDYHEGDCAVVEYEDDGFSVWLKWHDGVQCRIVDVFDSDDVLGSDMDIDIAVAARDLIEEAALDLMDDIEIIDNDIIIGYNVPEEEEREFTKRAIRKWERGVRAYYASLDEDNQEEG